MSTTRNPGQDWSGPGSSANRDKETGLRYGIISCNDINPEAIGTIYQNGRDLGWESAELDFKGKIEDCLLEQPKTVNGRWKACREQTRCIMCDYFSDHKWSGRKTSQLDDVVESLVDEFISHFDAPIKEKVDCAFEAVSNEFSDVSCMRLEGGPMYYESDGYALQTDDRNDLWVFRSPYYTYAQYCSPCAPGAVHLGNPIDIEGDLALSREMREGYCDNQGYCLGHEWFDNQEAPYPVFSVATNRRLVVRRVNLDCPNCDGTGNDTVARLAKVRQVLESDIVTAIEEGEIEVKGFGTDKKTFHCFRCHGLGTVPDTKIEEV